MGQWNVAMYYYGRCRELAEEHGLVELEVAARANLADCAVQLLDPVAGFQALSQLRIGTPQTRQDTSISGGILNTLARLYLLVGDVDAARVHAQESARIARVAYVEKETQSVKALLGLIDVRSGAVEKGLSAVERALTFAKLAAHTDVPDYLGICIEAYEAARHSDKALEYLQELVAWKKKSVDAEIMPTQYEGLSESIQFQTGSSHFNGGLLAKAHSLQADVQERLQRFVETAINAEIASGHDLYRTFRVAKLARYAAAVGWDEPRIALLALERSFATSG
jgi:tetratricopeptide (TPR) repeat protein